MNRRDFVAQLALALLAGPALVRHLTTPPPRFPAELKQYELGWTDDFSWPEEVEPWDPRSHVTALEHAQYIETFYGLGVGK